MSKLSIPTFQIQQLFCYQIHTSLNYNYSLLNHGLKKKPHNNFRYVCQTSCPHRCHAAGQCQKVSYKTGQGQGHMMISVDLILKSVSSQEYAQQTWCTVPHTDQTIQVHFKFVDRYTDKESDPDRQTGRWPSLSNMPKIFHSSLSGE